MDALKLLNALLIDVTATPVLAVGVPPVALLRVQTVVDVLPHMNAVAPSYITSSPTPISPV